MFGEVEKLVVPLSMGAFFQSPLSVKNLSCKLEVTGGVSFCTIDGSRVRVIWSKDSLGGGIVLRTTHFLDNRRRAYAMEVRRDFMYTAALRDDIRLRGMYSRLPCGM